MTHKIGEFEYFDSAEEIYKGDGIDTCKWCGDSGYMHTFGNDGRKMFDAPCICKIGQEILYERMKERRMKNGKTQGK